MPCSQKRQQNRATDEVMATKLTRLCGHRQCRGATGEQAVRLSFLRFDFVMPALHSKTAGQAAGADPDAFLSSVYPRSASHHDMASNLKA